MNKKITLLGLTGAPGAGKSLAAEYLRRKGAKIISGDLTGREVLEKYPAVLKMLRKQFGDEIMNPDNTLNRKRLGSIVFADPDKLKNLNSIVHPYLLRILKSKINDCRKSLSGRLVVVDAALIFEWSIEDWFDYILVIIASRTNRIKRMMASGLTGKEAENRIGSQISQRMKASKADFVIENNGGKIGLRNKVYSLADKIKS